MGVGQESERENGSSSTDLEVAVGGSESGDGTGPSVVNDGSRKVA